MMRNRILKILAGAAMLAGAGHAATSLQNQNFVNHLYQDLLNRQPSRMESAAMVGYLNFGATRTQIAGLLTSSNEYRMDLIQQFYGSFLKRPAGSLEVNFYLNLIQQGATDDDIKSYILGSDEYYRLAGATVSGFLNKLYEDVLGRPIDRGAELMLASYLANGATRQAVAKLVLQSLEADQREVTQLYQKLLKRLPGSTELSSFSQMLQTGAKDEFVMDTICGSDEYFQLAQ